MRSGPGFQLLLNHWLWWVHRLNSVFLNDRFSVLLAGIMSYPASPSSEISTAAGVYLKLWPCPMKAIPNRKYTFWENTNAFLVIENLENRHATFSCKWASVMNIAKIFGPGPSYSTPLLKCRRNHGWWEDVNERICGCAPTTHCI